MVVYLLCLIDEVVVVVVDLFMVRFCVCMDVEVVSVDVLLLVYVGSVSIVNRFVMSIMILVLVRCCCSDLFWVVGCVDFMVGWCLVFVD